MKKHIILEIVPTALNEKTGLVAQLSALKLNDLNLIDRFDYRLKPEYTTISRSKNFDITDNSYHGYGKEEQVNVDFGFILKTQKESFDYKIIKQSNMQLEGSDHRPVIYSINNDKNNK